MHEGDLDWLYYICKKRYSSRYDAYGAEGWFRNVVMRNPLMFLPQRMPNAFCISLLTVTPWLPSDFHCNIVFICADDGCHWEAMKLIRSSIEWAKVRKCVAWSIASDTDVDLSMFAKRIGATAIWPRYVIKLSGEP